MLFSDKNSQLFLNCMRTPQISFQLYKPPIYKPLTYVTLCYGILDGG